MSLINRWSAGYKSADITRFYGEEVDGVALGGIFTADDDRLINRYIFIWYSVPYKGAVMSVLEYSIREMVFSDC
jgi:hypothetical protein